MNIDGLNFEPVEVNDNNRKGTPFTKREKEIAREAVIEVIKEQGGIPTRGTGEESLAAFVSTIRTKCANENEIPKQYADEEKTRSYASYAHLARQALKSIKKEAEEAAAVKKKDTKQKTA